MSDIAAASASSVPSQADSSTSKGPTMWSHGNFSFKDLIDIVNPLQHIPVIGSIYRYLTGDEPSTGTRIIGDGLYGGPIGFGISVAVQAITSLLPGADGRDLGEQALAAVFGQPDHSPTLAENPANPQTAQTPAMQAVAAPILLAQAFQNQPGQAQMMGPPQLAASLYRSPAAATPPAVASSAAASSTAVAAAAAPALSGTAQGFPLQRQFGAKPAAGQTLNTRAVPLELGSNLLPIARSPSAATPRTQAQVVAPSVTGSSDAAPNLVAQKMRDALDKYERMKKQQLQEDTSKEGVQTRVDLSL